MNYYFATVFVFSFFLINPAWAYNTSINEPAIPYEIFTIETNIEEQSEYLGDLQGDPHMYEFTVSEPVKLSLQIAQQDMSITSVPFSLITIKQNGKNRGVTEIGRLKNSEADWQSYSDKALGLKLIKGDVFEAELEKGVYRVEVSTPDNIGKYMLILGHEQYSDGYFKTLSHIRTSDYFILLGVNYVRLTLT